MLLTCLSPSAARFADLASALPPHGIDCVLVPDEFTLLRRLDRTPCDAVLIDVGWNAALEERLLSWLELRGQVVSPIVVRSVAKDTRRVTRWLHAGAADVVGADVDATELAARLLAAARRRPGLPDVSQLAVAGFSLDRSAQRAFDQGRDLGLTPREFGLAWLFFSHPDTCLSRSTISLALWGTDQDITARTLEQHVHRLRKKMNLGQARGVRLRAAYGAGYRLSLERRAMATSRAAAGSGQMTLPLQGGRALPNELPIHLG